MKHLNLSSLGVLIYFALLLSNVSVFGQNTDDGKPKISFQGVLKTASGEPVPDAEYSFVFSFWRSKDGTANTDKLPKAGSTEQWIESVSLSVEGGIYSHNLGSITDLNPENFNGPVYLNIKVGGKDILPRTEFTYSPFAFSVATAQNVVCSGAVGDIKYSILPPDKFNEVNGDCWVPLDGRSLSSTDKLHSLGVTILPNAGGMFLRAQEFQASMGPESWRPKNSSVDWDRDRTHSSPIGIVESQEFQAHSHGAHVNDPGHIHAIALHNNPLDGYNAKNAGFGTAEPIGKVTEPAFTGIQVTVDPVGGFETRPVNMNFWIYIRIN